MKKWLRKKLMNIIQYDEVQKDSVLVAGNEAVQSDPVLQFRVFSAVGGKVVEFSHYDLRTDRRNSTTYIITDDQDFGERIAKISTMESLKL